MISLVAGYVKECAASDGVAKRTVLKRRIFDSWMQVVQMDQVQCGLFEPECTEGRIAETHCLNSFDLFKEMEVNCALCSGDKCGTLIVIERYVQELCRSYVEILEETEVLLAKNKETQPESRSNVVSNNMLQLRRRIKSLQDKEGGR